MASIFQDIADSYSNGSAKRRRSGGSLFGDIAGSYFADDYDEKLDEYQQTEVTKREKEKNPLLELVGSLTKAKPGEKGKVAEKAPSSLVTVTPEMVEGLQSDYQNVPFVAEMLKNTQPTGPVKPLDQIRADLRAKDKPSWGETLYYNLLSGAGDVAKSYANIPVLAEKLVDKAIPGEQQLTPRAQRLQDMLAKTEELQSVFDESQAKAPLIQRVAGGITRSLPSIGSAALTGNAAGSVPVMFGIQAGSNYEREAEAEGADPLQASAYGAVMGTVEALTEKIPFEEMMAAFGGKGGIKALLRGMTAEGLQEVVTNPLQVISKRLFYNGGQQEPILDAGRELESFLAGAGTMGVLHGAGKAVNAGGTRVNTTVQNQIPESPVAEDTGRESHGQVNPLPAFNRLEPEEKTETPGASGEGNGSAGAAHSGTMRIRPEMGAGVSKSSVSGGKGFNTASSFSDTGGYADIEPESSFNIKETVEKFVDETFADNVSIPGVAKTTGKSIEYKKADQREIEDIKRLLGVDVTGFSHKMNASDLRHIIKQHGDPSVEVKRHQLTVTVDDLKKIPDIIENYDSMSLRDLKHEQQGVIYKKRINGHIFFVEVIGAGKKSLMAKTMWKIPSGRVSVATPESNPSTLDVQNATSLKPSTDDYIMPQGEEKIKPEGKSHSDTGGYAEIPPKLHENEGTNASEDNEVNPLAVEMPEMLELVKSINEGKNPLLKQKLGNALGKFVYSREKGDIKLRNDIFTGERLGRLELNPRKNIDQQVKDFSQRIKEAYGDEDIVFKRNRGTVTAYRRNPNLAARVLAHEIGHLADWLPDKTLSRGNILGRVASLKSYMKHLLPEKPGLNNILTDQDRRRLRREATKLAEAEKDAPEPEEEGIKPEDVLAVWNDVNAREKHPDLFKYVSRLGRAEKTQILREALRGMVKFQLSGSKGKAFKDWSVREKELYRKLVKEEIVKRRLFEMETVRDELKKLTQVWKPFDAELNQKYTKYRYSSPELYADAISVLFNNPSLLKKEAPTFHRAFFNYLGEKPEVKAVYDEIQTRLGDKKATLDKRLDDVYRMFTAGHMKRNLLNQRRRATIETVTDTLMRGLVDKNQGILKLIRQGEKQGGPVKELARKARWEIEETGYISSEAANYLYDVGNDVLKLLQENGLTVDDAGTYMMLKRITSDRTDLANPLGHTGKTATETLEALKNRLGEKGYQALEEGVEKYRAIREKLIMPRVREGKLFSPELLEVMDSQKNYAKFNVQHYLEETYGPGTTARVYKQVGTLSDIENPFEVTVLQDISMLRAAKINEAKLAAISYLQQINNLNTKALSTAKKNELVPAAELNIITPAETRYDGVLKKQVPVEPKDPGKALLQVMVDGNLHSFYVGKEIAETFEYQPFEATKVAEIWGMIMSPVKSALVSKNPRWMARNLVRDLRTTYKNIPELKGFKSTAKFLQYYGQAFGEASKAVFKGNRSEDLNAMYKGFMLNPDRMYSSRERNSENDLERLTEEFQLDIYDEKGAKTAAGRMRVFLKLLDKAGRVSEMTGKLAGYKYLTSETSRSKEEVAHVVRTRIGTPDTRRAGKWQQVTNNVFLFSNVNKEGWRSAGESIKEDPGTYLWKTILVNVLPKLFLLGLGAGILKKLGFDADDKWGKLIRAIPEYDKRSYNIIPLGMTEEGKAAYIRLPEDYEGQVFGGIAYQLFRGQLTGKNGVMTTLAEQSPYDLENPNPVYGVSHDLVQYYLFHQNPVDEYRGRNVLPDSIFKAGGKEAHQKMFEYAWKSFGGDSIVSPSYDLDETALQKALKYPPFNIIGTFVKISDRGKLDEYYAEKDRETAAKARETLKLRERIVESAGSLKREPGVNDMVKLFHELRKDEIIPKGRTFGEFRRQYINYAAYAVKDKTLSMIMAADTTEDRRKLLARAREDLAPKQFYELKAKLRKMGVVVPNR